MLYTHHIKTKQGTHCYIVTYDKAGLKRVDPICKYLKMRAQNGDSLNILKNHASYLKNLFIYLEDREMTYLEFITPDKGKTVFDKLVDYKMYLTYKNYSSDNVIPLNGYERARKDSTVNQMMSTVLTFYSYLATVEDIPELNFYIQKATNQHFHSMLSQMYKKKVKAKKNLLMNKVTIEPPKYITREQFFKLWDLCSCRRDRIILGLGFLGGLRIGETIGINLEDLSDINESVIYIKDRIDENNPDASIKTTNSVGCTVVPDMLRNEIVDYMNEDLKGIDTNYLLINFKGDRYLKPMRKSNINKILKRLGKKIGIENLHSHMLRHGCAMDMLRHGVDIAIISDKLRHVSINTTKDIYARFDLDKKIEVTEKYVETLNDTFSKMDIQINQLFKELGDDTDE